MHRSQLSGFSQGQLYRRGLSKLFKCKLSMWILLVAIDIVICITTFVLAFTK